MEKATLVKNKNFVLYLFIASTVGLTLILIYSWSQFSRLEQKLSSAHTEISNLNNQLTAATKEKQNLAEALTNEQSKNSLFEQQIKQIASTVGNLDKLSKTDPELLQKYSKVYFLSENYTPANLTEIPSQYLFNQSRLLQIHTKAWSFLEKLLVAAQTDGIELKIISAYRSFGTQSVLKTGYNVTYGAGSANQFSADQGYSEHQLGTTLDFTTLETSTNFSQFKTTDAYQWLQNNAYKYGFILSYPENNSFYQFEPWHWRFVGKTLALRLREARENFYDLSQREIDEYLISLFD